MLRYFMLQLFLPTAGFVDFKMAASGEPGCMCYQVLIVIEVSYEHALQEAYIYIILTENFG